MSAEQLPALVAMLRDMRGIRAKEDISSVAARLGLGGAGAVPVGDDCAAIPDGDGYLLLAIEGFMNEFVAGDPWFAGWCGVMVNVSDILAMGGRPIAVVDAIWAKGEEEAAPVLDGMRAAAEAFGVPIVGGHSNARSAQGQLSVAILGLSKRLLTSFDARPGEALIAAVDLDGRYREPFNNFEAATTTAPARLKRLMELLPSIAEDGLAKAAKDISQGGIVGTTIMLAECSGVGAKVDLGVLPRPEGIALSRWLQTFPSYGYLLSVPEAHAEAVLARFRRESVSAARIGTITHERRVTVSLDGAEECIWDLDAAPLIGCGPDISEQREDAA